MHRSVPWVFLALVVLTLGVATAWPWRHGETSDSKSRSKSSSSPRSSSTSSSSGGGGSIAAPSIHQEPDGSLTMLWRSKPAPGTRYHQSVDPAKFRCVLDKKVTAKTIKSFAAEIGDVWGDACGRNRGIFVLNPPDGNTYDCGELPKSWGVPNVGSILTADGETAYKAFGNYISAVYNTSIVKGITACDFNGLAYLECGREEPWKTAPWYPKLQAPIRSVNIGGLFVLERWILPSFTQWGGKDNIIDQHSYSSNCEKNKNCENLKEHWKTWYTLADFQLMKKQNLNTIRLPVGWWYFAKLAGLDSEPYVLPDEDILDPKHPITNVLRWANEAGLHIIFDLHGLPGTQNNLDNSGTSDPNIPVDQWGETWLYSPTYIQQSVQVLEAIAKYLKFLDEKQDIDNIIMIEVANEPWVFLDMGMVRDFYILSIGAIRAVLPDMPILLHDSFHGDEWKALLKYFPYDNIFMDTHLYHGFNTADVASDTYQQDKLKMYVHERMSCAMTSMLRFETCSAAPTIVGEWSLAIDNCMDFIDSKFADYGQCDRIGYRTTDPWWKPHIKSFAHRQIDVYERELGWSFWTWKLDTQAESTAECAPLWSFRLAVEKGYIDPDAYVSNSCMHNPTADWQGNTPGTAKGAKGSSTSSDSADDDDASDTSPVAKPKKVVAISMMDQQQAGHEGVQEFEDVDIATPPQVVEEAGAVGPAVDAVHSAGGGAPVLLLALTAMVTLLGVATLTLRLRNRGGEEGSSSPFMRRILGNRRRVAVQLPGMVLGMPRHGGYQQVAEPVQQESGSSTTATTSIQV